MSSSPSLLVHFPLAFYGHLRLPHGRRVGRAVIAPFDHFASTNEHRCVKAFLLPHQRSHIESQRSPRLASSDSHQPEVTEGKSPGAYSALSGESSTGVGGVAAGADTDSPSGDNGKLPPSAISC